VENQIIASGILSGPRLLIELFRIRKPKGESAFPEKYIRDHALTSEKETSKKQILQKSETPPCSKRRLMSDRYKHLGKRGGQRTRGAQGRMGLSYEGLPIKGRKKAQTRNLLVSWVLGPEEEKENMF